MPGTLPRTGGNRIKKGQLVLKKTKKKKTEVVRIPKKSGRPLIEIDWDLVESHCQIMCTLEEISAVLKVSEDTIERACLREKEMHFADYFKKHSASGRASLRRAQFQAALSGDRTMQVWLGKNLLGQKDRKDITSGDKPMPGAQIYLPDNGRDPEA